MAATVVATMAVMVVIVVATMAVMVVTVEVMAVIVTGANVMILKLYQN